MGLANLPWNQENWHGWKAQLSGPPLKLLIICSMQIALQVTSLFIGLGKAECEVTIHGGGDVEINCGYCQEHTYVTWQQVVLLLVALVVTILGIIAALFRSKRMCRVYGLIMMVYAFVIGLTSLLTGLDTIVLNSAVKDVTE